MFSLGAAVLVRYPALAVGYSLAKGMKACCGNCTYWSGVGGGMRCQRRSPIAAARIDLPVPGYHQAVWPPTQAYEWCGEWAAGTVEALRAVINDD